MRRGVWLAELSASSDGGGHRRRGAGLAGLAVLADEGAVLAELPGAVGVLHQAVPADAIPQPAAVQGGRAAALQRLLLAVTAHNGDGWSGSAAQTTAALSTSGRCREARWGRG